MNNGNILIVDDTLANLKVLEELLSNEGYEVRVATNGHTALRSVEVELPELILLDIMMPNMDGFEVCKRLKTESRSMNIPVIFISALKEINEKIRAFNEGGVDYITKPFQSEEVLARVATHIELYRYRNELEKRVDEEVKVRIAKEKELIKQTIKAETDQLTGIYNRHKMENIFENEFNRVKRYEEPLSLIMFDIDHFKKVNDNYGHDVGDLVLKEIVKVVNSNIRNVDVFARWGGEEFIIMCPETDLDSAVNLSEKLRKTIEEISFKEAGKVTVSFGVTSYKSKELKKEFIKRADVALYKAKNSGRNKVEVS